ncbi:MAG: hypothetical protein ABEH80_07525, partial [Halobaculum sp.]
VTPQSASSDATECIEHSHQELAISRADEKITGIGSLGPHDLGTLITAGGANLTRQQTTEQR